MKKKKWVILRLETKSREFQSRTLLAYHIVNKGYGVILSKDYGLKSSVFPKGIYLLNNIFKTNNLLLRKIKKNHNKIIILDEEGLLYINKNEYLKRIPEENLELISNFLCFGKEQSSLIKEAFPKHVNKITITGNPRINLLNRMFDRLEMDKVESIRNKHGKYFLIVSNFSIVNYFGAERSLTSRYEAILKTQMFYKFLNSDVDIRKFKESFHYINKIFESFLDLAEILARKFPEMKVIIRPHPSEDKKLWEDIASKHTNVEVIFEGNLTEWIKGSELVIQNSCTSAIESLYLHKNCISYRPFSSQEFDQPLPNKLSLNITTLNEVLNIASEINNKNNNDFFENHHKRFRKMASENISYPEKDESIDKILEEIEKIDIKTTYFSPTLYKIKHCYPRVLIPNLYSKIKIRAGIILHYILKSVGLVDSKLYAFLNERVTNINHTQKYQQNKWQSISTHEIDNTLKKYNSIYSKNTRFTINQLDHESFIIE